ncbi:MAG TPA: alpha/beta hydrolase [Thermoanaerobaculia bacterium]
MTNLYRDVPAEQVETLRSFRAEHPYRRTTLRGIPWEHIVAGEGERALLLLPGALGTGESNWQSVLHFSPRYRVVSPTYAPVSTMVELTDGIAEILEREGIGKATVIGGSYGGLVAQVFVRRHPGRTEDLVLSHTVPPDRERGRKVASALRWLGILPMGLLRFLIRKRLEGLLPRDHPDAALVRAYFRESIARDLDKEGTMASYRRVADFDTLSIFTPGDLDGWPGRVLLLMTDNDPATPEPVREVFKTLYPHAEVRLFKGTGHATAILQREAYLGAIEEFLSTRSR